MISELVLCKFCIREVSKPCLSRETSNSCWRTINKTRAGGAGAKTITFDVPHRVSFHTVYDQVKYEWAKIQGTPRDPLKGMKGKEIMSFIMLEAERRFIEWQKAAKKVRWHEVLKIPHKGTSHEILVVRKFRDPAKAEAYAERRTKKAEGAASYQVQIRQGVVPVKPGNGLLGFDPHVQPNQESIMAKAKAKKGKKAGNGAVKVKKDKAYYLKCTSGTPPKASGDFIRGRILQGKMSAEDIATEVRKKFKGHSTKPSDVYWNRGQLKKAGISVPKMAGKD